MFSRLGRVLLVLLVALMATYLLSACGGDAEQEEIAVDERGLSRARGGIEAMIILGEKGVVLDAAHAFDRIDPFFPKLVEQLKTRDELLAAEVADTTDKLRDAASRMNLGEMIDLGRNVDSLLERSAAALGFSLVASMLPSAAATPTATPSPAATPTP